MSILQKEDSGGEGRLDGREVAVNDAASLREMSVRHYLEENYDRVATLTKQAAELGDAEANFLLATVHCTRHGVVMDDDKYSHQRPP